jgi:hypothetical protein
VIPKLDHPDDWGDFEEAGLEPLKALLLELDYHAKMDALKAQKSWLDAAASEGSR